jgi:hypothetical protein
MSIPISDDKAGWGYERTSTRAFQEIIISEGPLHEAVQAMVCRHCGHHRVKLVGFGREAAFCRPVPPILSEASHAEEMQVGELIEVLIFKCPSCKKEMKIGADNSMSLMSDLAGAIEKDQDVLVKAVAEVFPDDYEEIKAGKKPVDVVVKLIRKYAALIKIIRSKAGEIQEG